MTLPSGNSQTFSVLLEFATNEELFDSIEKQTAHIADESKRAAEMTRLYSEEVKKSYPDIYKQIEAEKQAAEAMEKSKEAAKRYSLEIRNLRAQAREITSSVRLIRDQAEDLDRIFSPLAAGGASITGGIFAAASKYVKDATEATQVTREWKAAQADLERSGQRIGAVLAQEALPLLKQAAQITRQVADIIERNPEAVKATLYGGMLALAVGTIGKLYTQGLRLYADIKLDKAMALQFAAAELQLKASQNQLQAAGIQAGAPAAPTPTGGSGLGNVALLAGTIPVAAFGTFKLFQEGIALSVKSGERFQQALVNMGLISDDTADKLDRSRGELYDWAKQIPLIGSLFSKVGDEIKDKIMDVSKAVTAPSFLGGTKETQDKIVQAWSSWQKDIERIEQDTADKRKEIIASGDAEILRLTEKYNAERPALVTQIAASNQKAEQAYNNFLKSSAAERLKIIQDSEDRIRKLEEKRQAEEEKAKEDFQKRLEEIDRNFAKSSLQAAADRDALALVQAQDARDEAIREAENSRDEAIAAARQGTEDAIRKEKEETARRLAEFDARFAQERVQRYAEYQQQIKENAERLKQFDKQYQEERKRALDARDKQLKDLDDAMNKERIRRREQFIAQLSDLGVVLNNERQLRVNSYNAMLSDLTIWLNQMNAAFANALQSASELGTASGGSASESPYSNVGTNPNPWPNQDAGGYATKGIYRMAWDGKPEFVLSGPTTAAAERAIGGQLTQANLIQAISLMGSIRGALTYNDQRNFNSGISARQRRDIQQDTRDVLDRMLGGF